MGESVRVPFNATSLTGRERKYTQEVIDSGALVGNSEFGRRCEVLLETTFAAQKVMLAPSCTDALEMAAILCDVEPGDEVILPSFTFVSTANAFILRGAKPVFVDIRRDTFNY